LNEAKAGSRRPDRLIHALRAAMIPAPGSGRIVGSALADAVGTGLFMSGSVVYFSNRLKLDVVTIGAGFAVAGVVALLVVAPLGALADRFGYARSLRTAHFARAVIYLFYPLVSGAVEFTIIVTFVAIADQLSNPMIQAVVGTTVGGERRTETMGHIRAIRNAGFSLGALMTTVVLAIGTSVAYDMLPVINAVSFMVAGVLLLGIRNARAPREAQDGVRVRGIHWRYLLLAGLNTVMLLHDTILQIALPLFVLKHTRAPAATLPLLFVLNTVLVILLARWLSRRAATISGAARSERTAGLVLAITCVCLATAAFLPPVGAVIALVVGVALLTVGESLQIAGGWELSHSHAPVATRGTHLAVFSSSVGLQRSIGPAYASLLGIWGAFTWLPLAGAFVLAGTAMKRLGERPWRSTEPVGDTGVSSDGAGRSDRVGPVGEDRQPTEASPARGQRTAP
jgi:hypothetical protein